MSQADDALTFPCIFPIKAMGLAEPEFEALVVEIVRRYAPEMGENAVRSRPSRGGKWISVTITIEAKSREQLDAIYTELSAAEKVVIAL